MPHDIALVDDHHLMRSGLAAMVNGLGDYHVTVEGSNGRELIEALRTAKPPAIAIIDLHMPVMDGYETITWLRENKPDILPLALTFDATDDAMVKAVRAGARGFVLKNARPALLKVALDSIMLTGYYHSEPVIDSLMKGDGLRTREEKERDRLIEQITPREMEFLKHVCAAEEYTYEQIADMMGVHRRTVDNFRIGLFEKFNIKSKAGLVLFAMKLGILKP
jgi:DNA-binding NarL/FixJ family response regulator